MTLVKALKLLCLVLKLAVPSRLPPSLNTGQTLHTGRDPEPSPNQSSRNHVLPPEGSPLLSKVPRFQPNHPIFFKELIRGEGFH